MVANIGHNGAPVATIGELRWAIWNSDESLHVKALALCIVEHMGRGKPWSNPSKARLARLCSVSIKTVDRYIQRIERFLCVERRTGAANTYHARIASVAAELDEMLPTDSQSGGKADEPTPSESVGSDAEPTPYESPPHRPGVTQTGGHTVQNPPPHSPEPPPCEGVLPFKEPYNNLGGRAHAREAPPKPQTDGKTKTEKPKPAKTEKKSKRATQLPKDWTPKPETIEWARNGEIGATDEQIRWEIERFRNHAQATGRTQLDWEATYRNWMIKAKRDGDFDRPKPNGGYRASRGFRG